MPACQIFVSSTTKDLWEYREAAREVIAKVNETFGTRFPLVAVAMDTKTPDGERTPPLDDSRSWVNGADWVVLIVAWNYGYVPPGQEISVTEWEYVEATEICKPAKPSFVFLVGELNDPENQQYFRADRLTERVDLAVFRGHVDHRANEPKLAAFKARLRENRFLLYSNLADFRDKLAETLSNRIIAELFETMGPQIVVLGLQPPLRACFEEVKVLARLKRLHDRLHRIRQFGVRRWREEVATRWPEGGELPEQAELVYFKGLADVNKYIGEVKGLTTELPEAQRKALTSIAAVVGHDFNLGLQTGKDAFMEAIEVFASQVQKAFTACNAQMQSSARRLQYSFQTLTSGARSALERKQVLPARHESWQLQLETSTRIHGRLQQVLANHYAWQGVHDELERIDSGLDSEPPDADDDEKRRRARAFRLAVADLLDSNAQAIRDLLAAAKDAATEDEPERLKLWPSLILKVERHLDSFVEAPQMQAYIDMRKHFDDLFFLIDTDTLNAVEASEGRVMAMEAGLQGFEQAIAVPADA